MSRGRQIVRLKLRPLTSVAQRLLLDWEPSELYSNPAKFPSLDSTELFGNQNALEVEIGTGSGEFLCHLAVTRPEVNFLGIEVSRRASAVCASLAAALNLENLRVLRADFRLLKTLLPKAGWSKVYLHFPDPPHKTGDKKRRIFDGAFLDQMARTLIPGGEISVASDQPTFFFEMLDLAEGDGRFRTGHSERYLAGMELPVKSRFQLFWERKGVQPMRFILQKPPLP